MLCVNQFLHAILLQLLAAYRSTAPSSWAQPLLLVRHVDLRREPRHRSETSSRDARPTPSHCAETGQAATVEDVDIVDQRLPLCAAAHQLAAAGTSLSTGGNLSVRVGDRVLVTPSGARLDAVQPDQLIVVDMDGAVIEETRYRPTSELRFHLDLYRSTSASAIAHAHPMASVAVSAITELLPPIHYNAAMVGGSVRVAPYAVFGSAELSEGVVAALFERTAALMRNHGSVAIGGNIETACEHLGVVEWLSEVYLKALSAGSPAVLSDEHLTEVVATAARRSYRPFPGHDR